MRTMKKFYAEVVLLLAVAMLIPACSAVDSAPDCKNPDIFCIGLVTDVGKINNKSFNESAWNGLQQAAKELGAKVAYIETTDWRDYEKNITTFAEAGYDVIVTSGFSQGKATTRLAPIYPNIKFIGVDQPQNASDTVIVNYTSLIFHEDQAGFLVGALAAQMTKSKKIGAVCGTDAILPIWRYGEGYKAGAIYIDPAVQITVDYHNDISIEKAASDPEWGATTANAMIDDGVDVVFGAGGETGNGAIIAASQKDVYVIGVDIDQYYALPEAKKKLLSSAMKLVTPGVFDLIKMAKEGKFPGGNYYGVVQYAPFHNLESEVSPEIKTQMETIAQGLMDGSIETNVASVKP
jgi:basic membrane protein A and related proteins